MNRDFEDIKKFQKRTFILGLGKGLLTSLLVGKLYYLQILNKTKFGKLSETNRIKIKILYPQRGIIFDRYNERIAENRIDFQIILNKDEKKKVKNIISNLKKIIVFNYDDQKEIEKNLKRNSLDDFITIKKNLSWEELETFIHFSHKFPSLDINKKKVRSYKDNYAYSHVIGYVGFQSKKQSNSSPELKIGKTGIEKVYDQLLVGKQGWQKLESNSTGKVVRKLNNSKSISGDNLRTSILSEVQEFSYNKLKDKAGSIILINCSNGSIISMISSPSFDINEFSYGVKNSTWKELQTHPLNPLLNRSITGLYSPGSTFKLIVAMAVLEKNGFDRKQKFFCSGKVELGNHTFHCWKRKGHGYVDLEKAIKESCDCYFYSLSNIINIDELAKVANEFSIGRKTKIDLPDEAGGLMPTQKWKRENKGDSWHLGETYNAVIGQGFTNTTPLQMAVMTARIASGKKIMPSIVLKEKSEEFADLKFNKESFNIIRNAMLKVVNEYKGTGYASRLKSKKYKMAGKTGTSQVRRISLSERESGVLKNKELPYKLRDHSIFTGFAPIISPKYAIAVVVEHHGSGSKVAAPLARDIFDFTFSLKK